MSALAAHEPLPPEAAALLQRRFHDLDIEDQLVVAALLTGSRVEIELHHSRPPEMFRGGVAVVGVLSGVAMPLNSSCPVLIVADAELVLPDGSCRRRWPPEQTMVTAYWVRTLRRKLTMPV